VCQDISEIVPVRNDWNLKGLKQGLPLRITTAKYFVPRLLGTFRHRYPGINISLQVTNRQRVLERLSENLDDLYISDNHQQVLISTCVRFRKICRDCTYNHPLAQEKNILTLPKPFIMREPGSGTRMTVERFFNENRVAIKVEMEIGSNEAIKQAIVGGLGTVLSRHFGTGRQRSTHDSGCGRLSNPTRYVVPASKQLSVVANTFLEYLLKVGTLLDR